MAADFLGILEGFCLFLLIMIPPGYVLGWITNALRFRSRTAAFRLVASVPLSIACGPIFCYTVSQYYSLDAVLIGYGLLGLGFVYLACRTRWLGLGPYVRGFHLSLALAGAWVLIAVTSLADLQIGKRLYFSIISFDYAVRTAFTQSLSTYGVPALNPFFHPGHAVGLRYHYFWIALCGSVHRLGHGLIDARQAFIAGTIWCGIGLVCLIVLYLRIFGGATGKDLQRRSAICVALIGVTGLDLLPALLMVRWEAAGLVQGISPSVEWWNNQVDGWLYTMLWEPHYLCAVIACFAGFLILWDLPDRSPWRFRLTSASVAGAAFASAVGAGIYVTFVFAPFLAVWTLTALVKKWRREAWTLILAGGVAVALAVPYLHSLNNSSGTSGGSLLELTVRNFELGELVLKGLGLNRPWQLVTANALLLPLNYLLEFGFFFAAGILVLRRFHNAKRPATRQELASFVMVVVSTLICTFLKSGIVANNDLGWRGFLVAQFILLLWGGNLLFDLLQEGSRKHILTLRILIAVGVAGVAYDLAILRSFPLLSDRGVVPKISWLASDRNLGLRTYANREAYQWLRAHTDEKRIIQQNPDPVFQDTFFGLYGQRPTLASDSSCGTGFGGDLSECKPLLASLRMLYSRDTSKALEAACKAYPIEFIVAKDTDEVWRDRGSWVWSDAAAFHNDFVRLFTCHDIRGSLAPPDVQVAP